MFDKGPEGISMRSNHECLAGLDFRNKLRVPQFEDTGFSELQGFCQGELERDDQYRVVSCRVVSCRVVSCRVVSCRQSQRAFEMD